MSKLGVPSDVTEFYDTPEELTRKVAQLAAAIREARHLVAHTGAGISTSAKIPDYRGPNGVWTLRERGIHVRGFDITQAVPTYAHMALVTLAERDTLKHLVSTNVDGLHLRSGIPIAKLSELHGNCYKEVCRGCRKWYLRDYDCSSGRSDHVTGSKCDDCGGVLLDSIINFGENLPKQELESASDNSARSDVALVLGTSMRVSPACYLPIEAANKANGKLVIVNLQKTPYDSKAAIRIFAPTDVVMHMLMQELGIQVPDRTPEGHPVNAPGPYTRPEDNPTPPEVAEAAAPQLNATTGMFAIEPKIDCPHVLELAIAVGCMDPAVFHAPCHECNDGSENWVCLQCATVSCSRYVNGHAAHHNSTTGHKIAASFSDLSVWCYECEYYIKHASLRHVLRALHDAKFPPAAH